MAHTLSAKKRVRQSAKRRLRNRSRRTVIKTEWKKVDALIAKGDVAGATAEFKKAQEALDRIATRGTLHPNTAARRKSLLARRINALKAQAAK